MKVTKLANGKAKLTLSRNEWEKMGREAGWTDLFKTLKPLVEPIIDPVKKALEPEPTSPYTDHGDDEDKTFKLTHHYEEQQILKTNPDSININEIEKRFHSIPTSDAALLLAFQRALDYIKNPSSSTNIKAINGMKIILYRIINLPKDNIFRKKSEDVLKAWHKQKVESDKMWEKPKNPYL